MKQERYFCRECKREWMEPRTNFVNSSPCSITGNPIGGGNCPVCGSPEIQIVQFQPHFPGLDIPRNESGMPIPVMLKPAKPIEVIPGLVSTNNKSVHVQHNWLLTGDNPMSLEPESQPPSNYDDIVYGE